ncbi:MAG: GNAT family N-acetyltransferase [Rhodothermales bacterium]|nr:GNAT family N-acetyltransferase [Rhodothermales bacterium]
MSHSDSHQRPALGKLVPFAGVSVEEISMGRIDVVRELNTAIFHEERIINTFDREDLLILLAWYEGLPVGFKIGYRYGKETFYSAKGGVLPAFRRQGVARILLYEMLDRVRARGYKRFIYDTFPNKHPGMTVMGLAEGFRVVRADYNPVYRDYRIQLEKVL